MSNEKVELVKTETKNMCFSNSNADKKEIYQYKIISLSKFFKMEGF